MTLLLTGANGFVGRHVQALMECIPLEEGGEPVELRDYETLRAAVAGHRFDRVLHLAAQSLVPPSFEHPDETYAVNFLGTHNLLRALAEAGFRGRMLSVGSGAMYGLVPPEALPVTESQPLRPRSPYAVSKVAAEAMCYQWSQSGPFEIVMARPFNHTGPGQSRDYALPAFAAQLAQMRAGSREAVLEVGDLEVTRDFCDVRDVVRAYGALLAHGRNGEAYNVCSGIELELSRVVADLARLAGVDPRLERNPARMRPADQKRMVGSGEKLNRDTGWSPEIEWEDTLRDILGDWENQAI